MAFLQQHENNRDNFCQIKISAKMRGVNDEKTPAEAAL